jgi:hypothetical protein
VLAVEEAPPARVGARRALATPSKDPQAFPRVFPRISLEVPNFSLAVSSNFKDLQGKKEKSDWRLFPAPLR